MTMEIIAICRSKKKMRRKAAAILDRYLFRIGDRTWKGRASTACLKRLSDDLKSIASRNLAVAVHHARSKSTLEAPIFIIGSKSRFSPSGVVPISIQKSKLRSPGTSNMEKDEEALVGLASLMHDIGKCTNAFQAKLEAALAPQPKKKKSERSEAMLPDAVRHEVFSAFFFDALCEGLEPDDHKGLSARLKRALNSASGFEKAATSAARSCRKLADVDSGPEDSIDFSMDLQNPELPLPGVLLLILSHHRLPWTDTRCREIKAKHHVNFERTADRDTFVVPKSAALWLDEGWRSSLDDICEKLAVADAPRLIRGDIYHRTTLMLGDHVGSHEKRPATSPYGALANTTTDEDGVVCAADSVALHTQRVLKSSRAAVRMMWQHMDHLPGVAREACPEAIREPKQGPERFAWQKAAAEHAAKISTTASGGFFGCILAGTGTGKTRGAPTILAGATFSDPDTDRRDLRYNLALGLRTLAHQSAKEYVEDLGFSQEDIAVLVGGETISWENSDKKADPAEPDANETGSEDRFSNISGLRAERPEAEAEAIDLSQLGLDCDRILPAFMERIIEAARDNGPMLRRLIASPLVVATIDHLMPAADARRSWHLASVLRLVSSDMIIDEIDQFSEEDLIAIERLSEIVGTFGRRLIIMSATMPLDIASQMHSAYRRGYSDFCRRSGKEDIVHVLVSGDSPDLIAAKTDPDFPELFSDIVKKTCDSLDARQPLRTARILPAVDEWSSLSGQIFSEIGDHHRRLSSSTDDGFQISAGLIRMTRVKHVQDLAIDLAKIEADDIHREYVIIHSRMPQIQRSWIEHNLRKALRRKGSNPDQGLISLLKREGVFQRARQANKTDIALAVISSPVIETGNDVDFDYAIIDPSSLRAIIQTGGRVRRHRNPCADASNIALLHEYSVSRFEGGKASMPGVETDPCNLVSKVTLDDCEARTAPVLLGDWEDERIDAGLMIDPVRQCVLREKEAELRQNYRTSLPAKTSRSTPLAYWSAKRPIDLMFRRSAFGEVTAFPAISSTDDITWWEFTGWRKKIKTQSGLVETHDTVNIPAILSDSLLDLIEKKRGSINIDRLYKEGSVTFFPSNESRESSAVRHPVLGTMKPNAIPLN
jgi:CRISPR-associated endonuclease/helicase Cas3